ncbi:MAG: HAMP domain-containing sensor histidine kinase [Bacteroidales bacterium]|jgi:nitrogen fixation/metabolism regulation signal transduction histidine kinase|nr:HAMP domain-containing sensor histidine kinase [Bacteroidales bacterium]
MGFNKFIIHIIARIILLAITALLIAIFALKTNWISTFIFLIIVFIIQIILLIRFASKVNRDLAHFLVHLKEQNTSLYFNHQHIDNLFGNLTFEFYKINEEFKKVENEKIKKQNLLNLLLNRVGTGILVINKKKEIKINNRALLKLLGIEKNDSSYEIKTEVYSLLRECEDIQAGNQKIVNVHLNNITRRILIALSEIKEENELIQIYTFHDIDREMTDYELQSWNGLIKVLSHEIMNTLTPMSTTASTLKDCLMNEGKVKNKTELSLKDIEDAVKGINLLENRIIGLQNFIKKFRQFLDIPVPELKKIPVIDILNELPQIFRNEKIAFHIKPIPDDLTILADKDLIQLILINLIKNAIEAQAKSIIIGSLELNKQTLIKIVDDGTGIDESIKKKIFLPFYTTKKDGSGIGLSLARQIMFAHEGNIIFEVLPKGSIVKLFFKSNY